MSANNEVLDKAVAGVLETLDGEGNVYRNGNTSAIILLEERILTVNEDGSVYECPLGE